MRSLIVFTFIFVMGISSAIACTCMRPDMKQALNTYSNTSIIVDAEVQLVSKGWGGSAPLATLKLKKVHKGGLEADDIIVIQYNPNSAACGMELQEGETYTLGLHDIRSMDSGGKAKVGDYRAVNSCEQMSIRYYLESKRETENVQ